MCSLVRTLSYQNTAQTKLLNKRSYVRNHETFNSLSFLSGTRIVQQAPGSVFSVTGGYALKYTPPIQHNTISFMFISLTFHLRLPGDTSHTGSTMKATGHCISICISEEN